MSRPADRFRRKDTKGSKYSRSASDEACGPEAVVFIRRQDPAGQLRAGVDHPTDSGAEREAVVHRECETRRGTHRVLVLQLGRPARVGIKGTQIINAREQRGKIDALDQASPLPGANASESSVGIRPSAETMTEGQPGLSGQSP